jgi:hypothetical protein
MIKQAARIAALLLLCVLSSLAQKKAAPATQKQDRSLAKWVQTVITSFDVKPDPATHQVSCIFHFAKAAQDGR